MSFRGTCWAWEVARPFDLGPAERLTLLSLGDGANKETGECWYKQETLCDMTGQSRSTIQRALASLAEKGLIRIEREKSEQGFNLACTYHLNLDVTAPMHHHDATVSHFDHRAPGSTVMPTDASPCCRNVFPVLEEHPGSDETPSVRARKAKHLKGFAEFWAAYPLKIKKVNAEKAWAALSKARVLPPLPSLLAILVRQIAAEGWALKEKRRFVPHASTWLNGKRWEDEVEAPEPERRILNPPPSPADLAARDLSRAHAEARHEILTGIAPSSDGWTGLSRTIFFDDLDDCNTPAEVQAHLAACRAVCGRLRASGAFPLRRATQPGEILPAGGGGPLAVDLRASTVTASDWPPAGWVVSNPDWPAGEGEHLVLDEDPASSAWAPGINTACPDGGRHDWEPNGKCGRCGELVGGLPYRDCNANPPAEAIQAAHSKLGQITPGDKKSGRVADAQHAYANDALSGACAICHQREDHIRHYLPQELPFNLKEQS